jgi:hypothetical protein
LYDATNPVGSTVDGLDAACGPGSVAAGEAFVVGVVLVFAGTPVTVFRPVVETFDATVIRRRIRF